MRTEFDRFQQLMSELGAEIDADLAPSADRVVTLEIGDGEVSVESPEGSDFLYFHVVIRRLFADRAAAIEAAMARNLFGLPLSGAWLALDPVSDELILCQTARLGQLTADSLRTHIEALAELAAGLRTEAQAPQGEPSIADEGFLRV
jgi:hypothetical protein